MGHAVLYGMIAVLIYIGGCYETAGLYSAQFFNPAYPSRL